MVLFFNRVTYGDESLLSDSEVTVGFVFLVQVQTLSDFMKLLTLLSSVVPVTVPSVSVLLGLCVGVCTGCMHRLLSAWSLNVTAQIAMYPHWEHVKVSEFHWASVFRRNLQINPVKPKVWHIIFQLKMINWNIWNMDRSRHHEAPGTDMSKLPY